jgi:hypothetical protein
MVAISSYFLVFDFLHNTIVCLQFKNAICVTFHYD